MKDGFTLRVAARTFLAARTRQAAPCYPAQAEKENSHLDGGGMAVRKRSGPRPARMWDWPTLTLLGRRGMPIARGRRPSCEES